MKVSGVIETIEDTIQLSESFQRRCFTLLFWNNMQKPETLYFEVVQDQCKLLDSFKKGDRVSVTFHLKGKKWVNPEGKPKYFLSLHAWRVELDRSPHPFLENNL
jgi:hypothetical protein